MFDAASANPNGSKVADKQLSLQQWQDSHWLKNPPTPDPFAATPYELLLLILSFLSEDDLRTFRVLNHGFKKAIECIVPKSDFSSVAIARSSRNNADRFRYYLSYNRGLLTRPLQLEHWNRIPLSEKILTLEEVLAWRVNCITSSGVYYAEPERNLVINTKNRIWPPAGLTMESKPQVISNMDFKNENKFFILDGRAYATGYNFAGQLGVGALRAKISTPTLVPIPGTVIQVTACDKHTIFLTQQGEVYVCGENHSGQFGIGVLEAKITTPTRVPLPDFVTQVIAGRTSTFFLTREGKVYASGRNYGLRLGVGYEQDEYLVTPMLVSVPGVVMQIVTEEKHTFFLTQSGSVYVCGRDHCVYLGTFDEYDDALPTLIPIPGIVTEVIAQYGHVFFLTNTGKVYVCGKNRCGQLGIGALQERITTPTIVPIPGIVTQVIAQKMLTVFLTQEGPVYICGAKKKRLTTFDSDAVFGPLPLTQITLPDNSPITRTIALEMPDEVFFVSRNAVYQFTGIAPNFISLFANLPSSINELSQKYFDWQYNQFMQGLPICWKISDKEFTFQPDKNPNCKPVYIDAAFLYAAIAKLGKKDFTNNNIATPEECVQFTALRDIIQRSPALLQQTKSLLATATDGGFITQAILYQSIENACWLRELSLLLPLSFTPFVDRTRALWQHMYPETKSYFLTILNTHLCINDEPVLRSISRVVTSCWREDVARKPSVLKTYPPRQQGFLV